MSGDVAMTDSKRVTRDQWRHLSKGILTTEVADALFDGLPAAPPASEDVDALTARVMLLPFLRHRATCALQAVRDNAPWDDLCTCDLRPKWLALESATPPVSGDVDAAWDGLFAALHDAAYADSALMWANAIDANRPVIEAAIRAESAGLDALREVAEAARVFLIRRSEHNADVLSEALARLTEAER